MKYLDSHFNVGHAEETQRMLDTIFGRGREEGCEKSPFNFAPLCNFSCHLYRHGYWKTREGKKFLFQKTVDWLAKVGYTLNDIDNDFLDKYKDEINKLDIKI